MSSFVVAWAVVGWAIAGPVEDARYLHRTGQLEAAAEILEAHLAEHGDDLVAHGEYLSVRIDMGERAVVEERVPRVAAGRRGAPVGRGVARAGPAQPGRRAARSGQGPGREEAAQGLGRGPRGAARGVGPAVGSGGPRGHRAPPGRRPRPGRPVRRRGRSGAPRGGLDRVPRGRRGRAGPPGTRGDLGRGSGRVAAGGRAPGRRRGAGRGVHPAPGRRPPGPSRVRAGGRGEPGRGPGRGARRHRVDRGEVVGAPRRRHPLALRLPGRVRRPPGPARPPRARAAPAGRGARRRADRGRLLDRRAQPAAPPRPGPRERRSHRYPTPRAGGPAGAAGRGRGHPPHRQADPRGARRLVRRRARSPGRRLGCSAREPRLDARCSPGRLLDRQPAARVLLRRRRAAGDAVPSSTTSGCWRCGTCRCQVRPGSCAT